MDYNIFHLGHRCQSLDFLRSNNLLTGFNPFSGTAQSFTSAINVMLNDFNDFDNYIVKFCIDKLNDDNDGIQFIRCYDYTQEQMTHIKSIIKQCEFLFFYNKNYYHNKNYCINLKYTDIDNFKINDLFFWKNNYLLLPNSDYGSEEQLSIYNRRKERFLDCLNDNNKQTLLVYMDTLQFEDNIKSKIDEIISIYKLRHKLYYIIPFTSLSNSKWEEQNFNINNITFYTIKFESLEFQKINNPNDDNALLLFTSQYNKIKENLKNIYKL